jgi:hypothetical protein
MMPSRTKGAGVAGPTDVDDYLAALPEDQRAALEKLRKTIKSAAPGATETISDHASLNVRGLGAATMRGSASFTRRSSTNPPALNRP